MVKKKYKPTAREILEKYIQNLLALMLLDDIEMANEFGDGKQIVKATKKAVTQKKTRTARVSKLLDQVEQESLERGRNLAGQQPL